MSITFGITYNLGEMVPNFVIKSKDFFQQIHKIENFTLFL